MSLANSQLRINWLKTPKSPPRFNEKADQNVQNFSYPTAARRSLGPTVAFSADLGWRRVVIISQLDLQCHRAAALVCWQK